MSTDNKRVMSEFLRLKKNFRAVPVDENTMRVFHVIFRGPEETPYSGGFWKIRVEIPEQYPYRSPSIGFMNKIYHPNVDERSGTICLDVINQTWKSIYDLCNVFDAFLPQLLRYPNGNDPLNLEAGSLFLRDKSVFEKKARDYVARFAREEDVNHNFGVEYGSSDYEAQNSSAGNRASSSSNSTAGGGAMARTPATNEIQLDDLSDTSSLGDVSLGSDAEDD